MRTAQTQGPKIQTQTPSHHQRRLVSKRRVTAAAGSRHGLQHCITLTCTLARARTHGFSHSEHPAIAARADITARNSVAAEFLRRQSTG
jgi:hypothetical protein